MKFLFVVQGEGRGHLTQAITLEEMLLDNGHEVVEVLVGKSSSRALPGFFNRNIHAPVKRFLSPNFLPTIENKRAKLGRSIVYNLIKLPAYLKSVAFIKKRIEASGADMVLNFYELLTGFTYALHRLSIPYICIGHQYMFLHPDFEFPPKHKLDLEMLRFFTRLTSIRCTKRLALSFYAGPVNRRNKIAIVPPLLRKEIFSLHSQVGDYIHGYMVNAGFADNVLAYHFSCPDVRLRFYWDKEGACEETRITPNLSFYFINDEKFLLDMASCKAYATTAGFESVCEAMYLGKPVLMVPAHIEQDCNAFDAMKSRAGIVEEDFNLDKLVDFAKTYKPDKGFVYWVKSCERLILNELEAKTDLGSVWASSSLSNYF